MKCIFIVVFSTFTIIYNYLARLSHIIYIENESGVRRLK